ncbi:MAG: hypothetical protein INQ03_07905 [Candidatus Heimdallarchaeota archaeon]|nr:hypothetical protein [Candidatus Heimdallarchaeota archaeon]
MSTTVRIKDTDKAELDKLQAIILLKSGKKLNYDELLHYLLLFSKEKVIEAIVDDISDQDIDWEYHLSRVGKYGETDSSDIDDVIYGEL